MVILRVVDVRGDTSTVREVESTPVASPSNTLRFFCLPTSCRMGAAISDGREHRRRHLVEQRLKDMVVAAIDQNHIGLGVRESARRRDPAEARADDHDALPRRTPAAARGNGLVRGRKLPRVVVIFGQCIADAARLPGLTRSSKAPSEPTRAAFSDSVASSTFLRNSSSPSRISSRCASSSAIEREPTSA